MLRIFGVPIYQSLFTPAKSLSNLFPVGTVIRRKRTMRFNLHGEVLLDGEVGGAAGARPSSSAKKLSSAPLLLTC